MPALAALGRRLSLSLLLGGAALIAVGTVPADASASIPAASSTAGVRHGIDVSHWQRRIDWPRVRRAGIRFAIAKATDGLTFVDGSYHRNSRQARKAGIRFTAYHFARPSGGPRNAQLQAEFFIRHARLHSGDLIPALDLETSGGLGAVALQRWVFAFVKRVEHRIGAKPMIYTSPGFWTGHMRNTSALSRAGYRVLWVAHYGTARPAVPARRWNGRGWTIWQWTQCGHVSGVPGCVDRDALTGIRLKDLTIAAMRHS